METSPNLSSNIKFVKRVLIFFILFLNANKILAFSDTAVDRYSELLKDRVGRGLSGIGELCEEVAAYNVERDYPPESFKIYRNLEYSLSLYNGELDIVVLDLTSRKVILVAEVKCQRDIKKASNKANRQLNRFQIAMNLYKRMKEENEDLDVTLKTSFTMEDNSLKMDSFVDSPKMIKICQRAPSAFSYNFQPLSLNRLQLFKLLAKFN